MDKNEIKRANQKALPKFILTIVIALVVGGAVGYAAGYFSGRFRLDMLTDSIKTAGLFFGTNIAPWLMVAMAVILPIVCAMIYSSCKKLLSTWDGEDTDISEAVDRKLSAVLWISSVALVFSFFLIAAAYSGGFAAFDSKASTIVSFISIAAFFGIMIESVIIQQKCVDTTKQMNPEKKASVYDMKFQKKWLDNCDEAEKLMIGKCAYKAFTATNRVCTILAAALAVCAIIFGIGFLPSLMVCLVWIVNLSVYCKEAIRYSKAGNKIS